MTVRPTCRSVKGSAMDDVVTLPLDANGHVFPCDEVTVIRSGSMPPWVMDSRNCAVCDERPRFHLGDRAHVVDPCPYPNGFTTRIVLNVPSGRIIVTDDLRPVYDWRPDMGMADYNSKLGQSQAVIAMAAVGCAYGPVGNSCPGMYRAGVDSYVIASPDVDWDDDEKPSIPDDARVASICTDLWAYSIADFEDWKAKGGDPDSLRWTDTVVDVTPGVYRFTHHTGERGFDHDAREVVFAHVDRIGDV
jgi:hypothetical protein